jgi:tetratricopeptide (TPR) repeat protein
MAEIAAQRGAQATAATEYLNAAERSADPEVSQRAAEFAYEYGYDAYALRAARRWAQLAPEEAAAQLVIARLLVRRTDVPGATVAAEKALGPPAARTGEDYLMLARELGEEANAEAVTRVMTRLAAVAPDSPELRLGVATAALRSRDFELALAEGRAVLAAGATNELAAETNALIGRALFASGEPEAALEHMRAQYAAAPTADTGLEYASLLATAERSDEALTVLAEVTERDGNSPAVRRLRALVSLNTGDIGTAWEEFSTLAREGEHVDESLVYLAEMSMKQQRFEQSLQLLGRVGSGPWLMTAQDAIARVAEAQDDRETALEIWRRAAERYPEYAFDADRYRAAALQRMGDHEQALAVLNELVSFRPDDGELLLARGALLEQMGRLEPALADMEAVVRLRPDSAVALNALGYTLANRTRRFDEAHALIRRAIEREPGSAAIMDSYGWVLFRQGLVAEARSWLQLAYARFPDPEVAAHLGEVMWQQGERDGARKLWVEALEKAPDSQPLKDTMVRHAR